ncbi:MAG: DegT/DnrJ/EryC1/StrS family aminotransferase [Gammaproteobacteria bacterium]
MQFIDLKSQYGLISDQINQRIKTVLDHGKFIMGPEILELEENLSEYVGVKYCISVSSGTDALLIAMMALDIGVGDEVITTPFSFVASSETIKILGAKPVFADIDPDTYNLDPINLEELVTPKTRAIMPVSLYGQCSDFDRINKIADKYHIPVIEDGAQSFGATYKGRKSCSLSTIGCTSFFPSKPLGGYGDGGAIFTNDHNLAKAIAQIRVHGQDKRYHHTRIGVNGRLDTIQAAVLLEKFKIFPDEVFKRRDVASNYTNLLNEKVKVPVIKPENESVFAQYTIEVNNRDSVIDQLKKQDIPSAVHYPIPLHLQPAFASLDLREGTLPVVEGISKRVMSLPMHPYLEEADQFKVVSAILSAIN